MVGCWAVILRTIIFVLVASGVPARGQVGKALRIEKTIEMPEVQGRIDHMSLDAKRERLFVSALGNGSVEVFDIKAGKRIKSIGQMPQPQGVLYVPETNRLYVANDGDGSVRIFDADSYRMFKKLDYGEDADNLRYDPLYRRIYVGYGSGALGEMDGKGDKVAGIALDAHPESFQLEPDSPRTYVNLPNSRKIAVLDRERRAILSTWNTDRAFANYAMALNESEHRLFVVTREPARLLVFDTTTGKIMQELPAVGDCDDLFYDHRRKRVYASGGEGAISVFTETDPDHYREEERVSTRKGARTSFFSSELDRLFLAVRRQGEQPAAIQVFAPEP